MNQQQQQRPQQFQYPNQAAMMQQNMQMQMQMPPLYQGFNNFMNFHPAGASKHSVFIVHLDDFMTEEMLWQKFKVCGNLSTVKLFRDRTTGKTKGMAFVDFESEDAVNQCIEKFNQKKLYANRIRICKKIDKSQLNEYKANTRFIRCLNPECYNQKSIDEVIQQLSNWFTKFGSVYTFKFGEKDDKWTGYGWVSFETKEAAAKVQEYSHENDNSEMAAWKIVFSKYESERPSDQKNLYLQDFTQQQWEKFDDNDMKNVEEQLRKEYSEFGEIKSIFVKYNEQKKKPFAFICFDNLDSTQKCYSHIKSKTPNVLVAYQTKPGQKKMQIQERYLLLRNLRTQDKENNPLTAEQVKENIAQALTSMDLNSTEFLKVGKNESKQSDKFEALYFAVVTFTTNDIAQKFLQRYMKECKHLFHKENPNDGVTICLPQEQREQFKRTKLKKSNAMQLINQAAKTQMGQQRGGNFQIKQPVPVMPMFNMSAQYQQPIPGQQQYNPNRKPYNNRGSYQNNNQPRNMNNMNPRGGQMGGQPHGQPVQQHPQRIQQDSQQQQFNLANQQIQQQQPRAQQQPIQSQAPLLTLAYLKNNLTEFMLRSKEEQQHQLGSMIYPRVLEQLKKEGKDESLASKITGMLIDAQVFELSDIVDFLEDPSEFKDRIYEALDLIQKSNTE